jgi:mannosyl-oligosaccharide glucosidase
LVAVKRSATTNKNQSLSIILYLAKDRQSDSLKVLKTDSNSLQIEGQSKYIGNFNFDIKFNDMKTNALYKGVLETQSSLFDAVKTIKTNLKPQKANETEIFALYNSDSRDNSSFIAFQVVFHSEAQIEMHFQLKNQTNSNDISYDKELEKRIETYGKEFEQKLPLSKRNFSDSEVSFAKATLSELIGSIGYFYGLFI